MSMSNDVLRKYFFDKEDKESGLLIGRDREPKSAISKKGIGSSPKQTPGRLWAKLDLELGPGPERGLGFCISRSFIPAF